MRDGQGHVETLVELAPQEPLLQVPSSCFVRIGRVTWLENDEGLAYDGIPEEFGDAEAQLLILQTALHNACGKVPSLMATHPVLATDLTDEVVQAVRAFRPSFRGTRPSVAGLFWSARVFRVPPAPGAPSEPCAIPLIDMLDHHSSGATGTWTGDGFAVTAVHPRGGSEVMLNYGLRRDAIGMAVVYGFADGSCQVAHASPMEVEVGGRQVVVEARGRLRDGTLLAPVVREVDGALRISHLPFRPGGGDALAATIGSRAVVEAIVETDVARCHALLDAVDGSVAAGILADAVSVHLAVLASR